MANKYFLKPNGIVIPVQPNHDIKSLEDRFVECDVDGKVVQKVVKKVVKKSKKKEGK